MDDENSSSEVGISSAGTAAGAGKAAASQIEAEALPMTVKTVVVPEMASERAEGDSVTEVDPQSCACESGTPLSYIYAIGALRPEFPSQSMKKAFGQAESTLGVRSPADSRYAEVLSQGQYLYIAREMCWVLQIDGGIDAYIVKPRTYVELNEIIQSIKPPTTPGEKTFTVIIGPRGPIALPEMCNGLQLPTVICNQIYDFSENEFIKAIQDTAKVEEDIARSTFEQMLSLTDNAGQTDEDRAINYIILRYMGLYTMASDMLDPNKPPPGVYYLRSVTAQASRVQGTRRIIDVIFHYEERDTGELVNWFCRVDVTGQFPFLVTKLSRFYPRP